MNLRMMFFVSTLTGLVLGWSLSACERGRNQADRNAQPGEARDSMGASTPTTPSTTGYGVKGGTVPKRQGE